MSEALGAVRAAHPGTRLCLWAQDESRFGLHTVQRRRLTLRGVKPVCPFEQTFESFWLCGAVQPNSGESFVLELPATDSDCLQAFLDQFAATHAQRPDEVQVLLMDMARWTPCANVWPPNWPPGARDLSACAHSPATATSSKP